MEETRDFMYRFPDCISTDKELTIANILSQVSEIVLWRYYVDQDFKLGKPFSAPYRHDTNPSFGIFQKNDRVYAKDFGGYFYGDIFNYVQFIYGLNYYHSLIKINEDFGLGLCYDKGLNKVNISSTKTIGKRQFKKLEKFEQTVQSESTKIQIVPRKINEEDLRYWNSYGISESILKRYNVYCVQLMKINRYTQYTYNKDDPAYGYYFPKTKHIKIYFPNRSKNRFVGSVNNYEDIQGYYQCDVKRKEDNKLLILTKSMKDVMTLRSFGIDAMAIHGERHRFQEDFIRHIKKYYHRIISLYDRDEKGMLGAKYLWKEYNIPPYFINKKYDSKDISDLYKNKGKDETLDFIQGII